MSLTSMIRTIKRRKVDKNLTKLDVRLKKGQITFDEALYRESLLFMKGMGFLKQINSHMKTYYDIYNNPKDVKVIENCIKTVIENTKPACQ